MTCIEDHYRQTHRYQLVSKRSRHSERLHVFGTVDTPPGTPDDPNWCTFLGPARGMKRLHGAYAVLYDVGDPRPNGWLRLRFHDVERVR